MENRYPVVLCHGMFGYGQQDIVERVLPYYGLWNTHIRKTFDKAGVHTVAPSLGPFTGAWDRACECYAQLVGGTVDYGKVHSEKYGHARYGRTYKALLPEWGTKDSKGDLIKAEFIGHSFGGATARMLLQLLADGSEEERQGTPAGELSPLFSGGKGDWVHSITTLASPHNGCTLGEKRTGKVMKEICILMCRFFGALDYTPLQCVYDLRLDQWGITTPPRKFKFAPQDVGPKARKYLSMDINHDNIFYDLSRKGAKELNSRLPIRDNVYYFSYRGQRTRKALGGLVQVPGPKSFPVLNILGFAMGVNRLGVPSRAWMANDLVINTVSGTAPDNCPSVDVRKVKSYSPGIWHVMPLEIKDHMSYLGWKEDKAEFLKFFTDIYDRVSKLD